MFNFSPHGSRERDKLKGKSSSESTTPSPSVSIRINSNSACNVWSELRVMVKLSFVESLPSQPTNLYPSSGVAVIVTEAPSSYSPPSLDAVPPSLEVTVNV